MLFFGISLGRQIGLSVFAFATGAGGEADSGCDMGRNM